VAHRIFYTWQQTELMDAAAANPSRSAA